MVYFFLEIERFKLPRGFKNSCRKIINLIAIDHGFKTGQINIIIVSDEQLLNVNQTFLKHDYYTDIITFNYNSSFKISGDLYISVDRIIENSKIYNCTIFEELKRVIIHGCLHLVGLDDSTRIQRKNMADKENYYLSL